MEKSYFGARIRKNGDCSFRIFAPHIQKAEITIQNTNIHKEKLNQTGHGFYETTISNVTPGTAYSFTLDNFAGIPDPASRWQPNGLRNASIVIDHHFFDWQGDNFKGLPISEMVLYEVHVGAFSAEHTFSGLISRLDHLKKLGINTLQLMPVAQFSGTHGWGYKTSFPYAVHSPYGSPDDLKTLIKRCHLNGIAVVIDASFASLNPVRELEPVYTPFFSEKYSLPHGLALNYDEKHSIGVREYFLDCALSWFRDYRIDGMRINDAHTIIDQTPTHFLEELSIKVKEFALLNNRNCVLITGDKRNELRPVLPFEKGGYNMDALYNDDFHSALQYRLTGEKDGIHRDYAHPDRIISAMQYGFAYRGELSEHHQRIQGRTKAELSGCKFVVYSQSHDPDSEPQDHCRIIEKAGFEAAKLSAGATLLSPYVPMIFMGEEYGESAPFDYFSNTESLPDAKHTFENCQLHWNSTESAQGKAMLTLYKKLLKIRQEHPAIHETCRSRCQVQEIKPGLVMVIRNSKSGNRQYAATLFNFNNKESEANFSNHLPDGLWGVELYSATPDLGGSAHPLPSKVSRKSVINLAPQSFVLLLHQTIKN